MVDKEMLQAIGDMMDEKLEERLKPIQEKLVNIETRLTSVEAKVDELNNIANQALIVASETREKVDVMTSAIKTNSYDIAYLRNKVS